MIMGLLLTLSSDNLRYWPLNGSKLKRIVVWFLIILYYFSLIVFVLYSYPTIADIGPITLIGAFLLIIGFGFFLWAIFLLRFSRSFGLKGELCTEGPYKLCRNPQCTGLIIASAGSILITLQPAVIILLLVHMFYLILTAFTEESWLKEQYGENYEEYRKKVPGRFIPLL